MQTNVLNCPRIGLLSQSVRDQSAIHPEPGNAGTIFRSHLDCGGISDSRQSLRNPVSTRPAVDGLPPDCNRMLSVDPELPLIRNPRQIAAQSTQIDTIKLDCTSVAKLQRIAMWLTGLHPNCTDCMPTARLEEGRRPFLVDRIIQQQSNPVLPILQSWCNSLSSS